MDSAFGFQEVQEAKRSKRPKTSKKSKVLVSHIFAFQGEKDKSGIALMTELTAFLLV